MNKRDALPGELIFGTSSATARQFHVARKCESDTGHWFCAACRESLQNNLAAVAHFSAEAQIGFTDEAGNLHDFDEHVAVWWCHEHGPEVP